MKRCIPLEKAAEQVCMENSKPPLIFQLPPERGRAILDAAQDSPVYKYPADVTGLEVDTGPVGTDPRLCPYPGGSPGIRRM